MVVRMCADAKTLPAYNETRGWKMPVNLGSQKPQEVGTLQQLRILQTGSFFPSLNGMEMAIPSFQSFIRSTPPLQELKPLPPTPHQRRRASSLESGRSSRPVSSFPRSQRTSSVYSQSTMVCDSETGVPNVPGVPSGQTENLGDQSNLLLRPIAYNASTSQLVLKAPIPQELQPRAYCPLINKPSPTRMRQTTPSLHADFEPSISPPPLQATAPVSKQHLRTISLEKAKELMQAPGAVHLLPEELQAQILSKPKMSAKARPQDQHRVASKDLPGRNITTAKCFSPTTTTIVPADTLELFHGDSEPTSTNRPIALQKRQRSRDKVVQAPSSNNSDEPRRRNSTREQRKRFDNDHLSKAKRLSDTISSSGEAMTDRQRAVQHYHQMLRGESRQASVSFSWSRDAECAADVRTETELLPQPLFVGNSVLKLSRTMANAANQEGENWLSLDHTGVDSGIAKDSHRVSNDSSNGQPLVGKLLSGGRRNHSPQSMRDSISISPRSMIFPQKMSTVLPPTIQEPKTRESSLRRNSEANCLPHFSPSLVSRMIKKRDTNKMGEEKIFATDNKDEPQALISPLFPADNVAESLETPKIRPEASPPKKSLFPPLPRCRSSSNHASSYLTQQSRMRLYKRMKDKLAKSGRSLSRTERSLTRLVASPNSPPMLSSPTPGRSTSSAARLGWSDFVRISFNSSSSSSKTDPKGITELPIGHTITPSWSLEESRGAMSSNIPPRRQNWFGGLIDSWRESKAEERRQDLKRMIKVATPAHLQAREYQ